MFTMKTGSKRLQVKFHHFQEFDKEGHLEFAQTFCVLQDLNAHPQILGEDFIYNSTYIDSECNASLCKNKRRKHTLANCLQEFYPTYLEDHKSLRREVWGRYFAVQQGYKIKHFTSVESVWQRIIGVFGF